MRHRPGPDLFALLVALAALIVLFGCAADDPLVAAGAGPAAAQAVPGDVPTTTTQAATTTAPVTVNGPPSTVVKEPPLPDGARHGDQPEVAARMAGIDGLTDCDLLNSEHDSDTAEADRMLATRDQTGHRARAELDGRYADQAHRRMTALGCYQIAHTE